MLDYKEKVLITNRRINQSYRERDETLQRLTYEIQNVLFYKSEKVILVLPLSVPCQHGGQHGGCFSVSLFDVMDSEIRLRDPSFGT